MTRRIIVAILVCVWAAMIAAGATAYLATRSVMLAELDARLAARAAALPGGSSPAGGDPDDRYLIRGRTGPVVRPPATRPAAAAVRPVAADFARLADGRLFRTVTVKTPGPDGEVTVVYSGPADGFDRVLTRLSVALGGLGVAGGVATAAVAAAAARAALRPLNDVAKTVGGIDERHLARRVDADRLPVELRPVAGRLNAMLERVERHVAERRQFLADVSHELRTPVAALVTTLEVNLARRHADVPKLREALEYCLSDARLLRGLVERLTASVRGDRDASAAAFEEVDLAGLLHQCATVADGLGLAAGVTVERRIDGPVWVRTQPDTLRRACLNVLSNAVAYNRPGGRVTVSADVAGRDVTIVVADTGVGIAAEHLPNVFSPFFRVDSARGTDDGHLGLGLYQVQADVGRLSGTCRLDSTLGVGTSVTILLRSCVTGPQTPDLSPAEVPTAVA